jgi:hypothetical protein
LRTADVADDTRNSKIRLIPNEAATVLSENTTAGARIPRQKVERIEITIRTVRP